jgi:hypothetical protein
MMRRKLFLHKLVIVIHRDERKNVLCENMKRIDSDIDRSELIILAFFARLIRPPRSIRSTRSLSCGQQMLLIDAIVHLSADQSPSPATSTPPQHRFYSATRADALNRSSFVVCSNDEV